MIDENKLIEELKASNYHHASNSREESLLDRTIRIVQEQPKDHDLDWYKHEYYAECDRADKLEKALDNAIKQCCIGVTGSDACNSLDELYEAFEKKVWENVE